MHVFFRGFVHKVQDFVLFLLFFVLFSQGVRAQTADPRDAYFDLTTGTFTSEAQAGRDKRYDHIVWHLTEAPVPDTSGARWIYTEQWQKGQDAPYRQRLQRYRLGQDGSIIVRAYRLPDAQAFVGAWKTPSVFEDFDISTLSATEGCDVPIARTGPNRFEGSTNGQLCQTSWRGASYVVSRSLATETKLVNWDRGFSSDGNQVWGPRQGGYEFRRKTEAPVCAAPVYMVVYGNIYDRKKFGAYARAIGEAGLYPKNQGYYAGITPVLDVFEGDPGDSHGMVLATFPCLQAARDFWYSDAYEKIKLLRQGISDFTVTVVKALPKPDYIRD